MRYVILYYVILLTLVIIGLGIHYYRVLDKSITDMFYNQIDIVKSIQANEKGIEKVYQDMAKILGVKKDNISQELKEKSDETTD